ncbi:MAG: DEAD/DEAH box helicase [Bdellovibrionales bacterium]|nr:DEAD/DEAH box helicase [Bdellovibrionales bacterium]
MVEINFNSINKQIVLEGKLKKLMNDSFIKTILQDEFNASILTDRILIPCDINFLKNQLAKLTTSFNSLNIEFKYSEVADSHIKKFKIEEKKFDEFSEKAKKIRNLQLDVDEDKNFKSFTSNIIELLPNRKLYEKQLLSAYHLAFSQNSCNFSVPGAGKTSIVYAAYAYLKSLKSDNSRYVEKLLVFGPLSSFAPWENEFEEIFGHKPESFRLSGEHTIDEKINYLHSFEPKELTLCSYGSLNTLSPDIISFLKRYRVMVVLDEAHYIKNVEGGITALNALGLADDAASRIILTGTPAPNGYEDLHNLFEFIWPRKNVVGFNKYQLKNMSKSITTDYRVEKMIDNISSFFIRIKKSDLELNPANENDPIIVTMGPHQKRIHDHIESLVFKNLRSSDSSFSRKLKKARMIRLRQAASNPSLLIKPIDEFYYNGPDPGSFVDDEEILDLISNYHNNEVPEKFKYAISLINEIVSKGEKVIVWLNFINNIKYFSRLLSYNKISNEIIYGGIPNSDESGKEELTRESIISEFNNSESSFKVLIANTASISESISLHKSCYNAIYLERDFNAGRFAQSKDRIHRYGMDKSKTANYFYILSDCAIENTIHDRLDRKIKRMNEIMERDEIPLFNFTDSDDVNDELKKILLNYAQSI